MNRIKFLHLYGRRFLSNAAASPAKSKVKAKENLSCMANIFRGVLEPAQVFPYPDVLSEEEKELTASLIPSFEKFFQDDNDAARNDAESKINEKTLNALWQLGAFGIQVPAEFGGLGLKNTQYARLCEIVGANDLGLGITIGAHQSIGFKGILLYGTPAQKQKYLPKVSSQNVYAAFALTEPSAGSDAASIRSRAQKSEDGQHFILNGSKIWISNGGIADVFTVFAQTEVVDEKTGEKKDKVTAFIVERSFGGVTNGPPEKKMGIKASNTAEVYFENVKIPLENVLGEVGEGFKVAMNILNNGRFGMGATLSGTMKYCIAKATEHASNRTQFGKKIKEFESIQCKIAKMSAVQYATESMAYAISQNMDSGSSDYHLEAAISKIYASESAWYVCDETIQILGGMGFMKDAGVERIMRDLRIFRIFEGTNDILRLFVALSGIQYAGIHLKDLQNALKSPATNLGFLFKEASRRTASSLGLIKPSFESYIISELHPYANQTAECIQIFGNTIENLLVRHGKNIINQQDILTDLANAAIDIYAMLVTQSRSSRASIRSLPTAENEVNLTKAFCLQAVHRCKSNMKAATDPANSKLREQYKVIAENVFLHNGLNTTHIFE